ncbi:hypothetical protein CBF90_05815 [Microbacterium sp. AISO3]|jgi:hypothetical protein|uniref:Uncharacterized protein n=2 Tax=Microbacterium TaxID=33882 RepID=A0ABU1I163_9MICO|nr:MULTISPECIES: hypothetical protein [Microbacterium]MDR6166838.1 hypothetical protein [Microbacterium paludicola]OAZ45673.1 hypothetical protein A9Z40_00740 [Microbacterium arborescens]OWP22429.1 hypothetical protein CBF90_05815 [Microbacterium sp. AISO3]POX66551.1 hypothetical protein C3481_11445 [Microbacterium sp. Ru50]QCR40798.1 hypothetical protein C1N74_10505 [Microbacterium sp. SGAir0570]
MPFRTKETLEAWLAEFAELGYPISERLRVMPQDGTDGYDTGLIGLDLVNAGTVTYLQPEPVGSTRWAITFEAREQDVKLDAGRAFELSAELAMVSALCSFLQSKSADFIASRAT